MKSESPRKIKFESYLQKKIMTKNFEINFCVIFLRRYRVELLYVYDNMFWILVTKIEPSRTFFEGKSRLSPHLTYTPHYYNSIFKLSWIVPAGGLEGSLNWKFSTESEILRRDLRIGKFELVVIFWLLSSLDNFELPWNCPWSILEMSGQNLLR
jgi:hypothetical protein